jgi:hypothetical protein
VDSTLVFFQAQPTTTGGSGAVTVANPDGLGTFTGTNQPYFNYAQIIAPYEISAAKGWQFNVPNTVATFSFTVYINTVLKTEAGPLLDLVWDGSSNTSWLNGANWNKGVSPDSASTVAIPPAALLGGGASQPALTADATATNLRVGLASTLTLNTFTLTAYGNVDVPGVIQGGTLRMAGSSALLGGQVDALDVTGSVKLQRPTTATSAVSVSGALNNAGQPLTITIP